MIIPLKDRGTFLTFVLRKSTFAFVSMMSITKSFDSVVTTKSCKFTSIVFPLPCWVNGPPNFDSAVSKVKLKF